MVVFAALAMISQHPHGLRKLIVAGHHGAGIAESAQVLSRVEAEASGDAHAAGPSALVKCAMGLAGILDYRQLVLAGDLQNRVHVSRLAVKVDGDDCPDGALC